MKHKFLFTLIFALAVCLLMSSCSANMEGGYDMSPSGGAPSYGVGDKTYPELEAPDEDGEFDAAEDAADGEGTLGDTAEEMTSSVLDTGKPVLSPGQLTAAAYFDIEHYDFLRSLVAKGQDGKSGAFENYYSSFCHALENDDQYSDTYLALDKAYILTFNGVKNGYVQLYENGAIVATASTDVNGRCILFGKYGANDTTVEGRKAVVTYMVEGSAKIEEFEITAAVEEFTAGVQGTREDKMEIMFVIDTTGSMGDELNYIKAEVDDVISRVAEKNPNTPISLALLFYRDDGDEYVTKYFDFTEDIEAQKANLEKQTHSGGGDFPEAVDKALSEAITKNWSGGTATKLIIHIADAPAHSDKYVSWMGTAKDLAARNISIITVASSGIDKQTEFYFRMQSLITNGCYVYLTNDSGIGGDHLEPTLEISPTVEHLNSLLVRLINGYHTGEFGEAVHWQQEQ